LTNIAFGDAEPPNCPGYFGPFQTAGSLVYSSPVLRDKMKLVKAVSFRISELDSWSRYGERTESPKITLPHVSLSIEIRFDMRLLIGYKRCEVVFHVLRRSRIPWTWSTNRNYILCRANPILKICIAGEDSLKVSRPECSSNFFLEVPPFSKIQ
jgi:hypothetical protein